MKIHGILSVLVQGARRLCLKALVTLSTISHSDIIEICKEYVFCYVRSTKRAYLPPFLNVVAIRASHISNVTTSKYSTVIIYTERNVFNTLASLCHFEKDYIFFFNIFFFIHFSYFFLHFFCIFYSSGNVSLNNCDLTTAMQIGWRNWLITIKNISNT